MDGRGVDLENITQAKAPAYRQAGATTSEQKFIVPFNLPLERGEVLI
jgi:hypothetical protein